MLCTTDAPKNMEPNADTINVMYLGQDIPAGMIKD